MGTAEVRCYCPTDGLLPLTPMLFQSPPQALRVTSSSSGGGSSSSGSSTCCCCSMHGLRACFLPCQQLTHLCQPLHLLQLPLAVNCPWCCLCCCCCCCCSMHGLRACFLPCQQLTHLCQPLHLLHLPLAVHLPCCLFFCCCLLAGSSYHTHKRSVSTITTTTSSSWSEGLLPVLSAAGTSLPAVAPPASALGCQPPLMSPLLLLPAGQQQLPHLSEKLKPCGARHSGCRAVG